MSETKVFEEHGVRITLIYEIVDEDEFNPLVEEMDEDDDPKQRKLDFIGALYPIDGYSAPPIYHRMDDSELSHAMHLAISVKLAMKQLDAFARECHEKYFGGDE